MKLSDINIRDPFVLLDDGKYYMYGTRASTCWDKHGAEVYGFDVYVSDDLDDWSDPVPVFVNTEEFWAEYNFWAPEVHKYQGSYYMLASFRSESRRRGTQILRADSPMGPFRPHSDGPVTPADWECLDGTLYVEDGTPYMVFCHEWIQVIDGEMCAIELTKDLKAAVGEPVLLFKASQPSWRMDQSVDGYVTDGPFLHKTSEGRLIMIWASFSSEGYCEALTYSKTGSILGEWEIDDRLLFKKDGGHGMLFRDKGGELKFVCHQPNETPNERPVFFDIREENQTLYVVNAPESSGASGSSI